MNGVVDSSRSSGFWFDGSTVLSKFLSAFVADSSMMSAFGFAAATAAIARGLVNGMTFGGGVEPFATRRFPEIEGINPSSLATLDDTPTSTSVRSSIAKSLRWRVMLGIERSAVP